MKIFSSSTVFLFCLFLLACSSDDDVPTQDKLLLSAEEGEEFSGGTNGTVFNTTYRAFDKPIPGLSDNQGLLFFVGNSMFNQSWVTAPASTKARDGLGPYFNARTCSSCHSKDGRGRPIASGGQQGQGLLLRLSIPGTTATGAPLPEPVYGGQLQDHTILKIMKEGGFEILYTELEGKYPDGTPYQLRKPMYHLFGLNYGDMAPDVQVSPRLAQQMVGLGMLEAIPESTLLSWSDPEDNDGDGISGRVNRVWDIKSQKTVVGRFGWKANEPSVLQQVAGAFAGDIGITSSLFPETNCTADCDSLPNGGTPEIEDDDLEKVALYSGSLAVPARRNWEDQDVLWGKKAFQQIRCNSCHIPKVTTGQHPTISAVSYQTIRPYTDLLLHDMGEGLADGRPDFQATGQEWRTPPLWGIGLFNVVNGNTFYLHDGRARSLEEAILWHGGEAEASKKAFMALPVSEREQVLKFLSSL